MVLASDGVWEFLEPSNLAGMNKKIRLKGPNETARCIFDASLKRWTSYEGDYCDDITQIVIQFNQQAEKQGEGEKSAITRNILFAGDMVTKNG